MLSYCFVSLQRLGNVSRFDCNIIRLLNIEAQIRVPDAHIGAEAFRGNGTVQILGYRHHKRRDYQHYKHGSIKLLAGEHILDPQKNARIHQPAAA
ncbi:hypothetical protein D3C81_1942880 [compost metagenome]